MTAPSATPSTSPDASGGLAEVIRERIERPELAAMLLAKTTVAAERTIALKLTPDSRLADSGASTQTLLTIIGNLIDNAIEAAATAPPPGEVTVRLASDAAAITIAVGDSGPGVPAELQSEVFTDGFTTKPSLGERHRGLGLALVHRLVRREGGQVWIDPAEPAVFRVILPVRGGGGDAGARDGGEPAGADPTGADGGGPHDGVRTSSAQSATARRTPA